MLDLRELAKEHEELRERQTEADCDCGPHTDEFRARGHVIGTGAHRRRLGRREVATIMSAYCPSCYYVIKPSDVGRPHITMFDRVWRVSDLIGRVLLQDVGKRVYLQGGMPQVENSEQLEARRDRSPCECDGKAHSINYRPPCKEPAAVHLFARQAPLRPVDFCEACGDDALASGRYVTGEDVTLARRCAKNWQEDSHPCAWCDKSLPSEAKICADCFKLLTTNTPASGEPEHTNPKCAASDPHAFVPGICDKMRWGV